MTDIATCPHCGQETSYTGYSQHRCPPGTVAQLGGTVFGPPSLGARLQAYQALGQCTLAEYGVIQHFVNWVHEHEQAHRKWAATQPPESDEDLNILADWEKLVAILAHARRIVDKQAEDEGLWFEATTASEAYLQQGLRKLHAAIESESAKAPMPPVGNPHECGTTFSFLLGPLAHPGNHRCVLARRHFGDHLCGCGQLGMLSEIENLKREKP